MNCMVTGGLGFIGSHLVERLVVGGHPVRILDPGKPSMPLPPGVELVQGDGSDLRFLREALEGVEVLFHLAGSLLPNESNQKPAEDVARTLTANVQLMNCAVQSGVRKLVYASSGGTVYGITNAIPVAETHATDPISSYGIIKLATEKYLGLFERLHQLQFAALRYSNPYGEGQDPFRNFGAVASFLGAISTGTEITIWGDGSAVRDFIYVRDAVEATLRAAEYEGPERIFNVGSGEGTSIRELLHIIETVTGRVARVQFKPAREGDVPAVVLDNARARKEWGWSPDTPLERGVTRTWAWCEKVSRHE